MNGNFNLLKNPFS